MLDSPQILVIDRSHDIRTLIREQINACGFDVVEAESCERAFALIREGLAPFAITCAINLPGRSGIQFVRTMQETQAVKCPIIIFSAWLFTTEIAANLGVLGIDKCTPDSFARLTAALKRMQGKARRDLFAVH